MPSESTARSIIYLGLDVHQDSVTIAVLPQGAKSPTRLERLPNDLALLDTHRRSAQATASQPRASLRELSEQCPQPRAAVIPAAPLGLY
jgi:hypothetical protein